MLECQSCGGRYEQFLPDGTQYFHACPPLAVHEIKAFLAQTAYAIPAADRQRLKAAQDADAANPVKEGELSRADQVLMSLTIERPNKRDENVLTTDDHKDQPARIKAAGAGVREERKS